jgi:phosphoglycerate dehydrogenase-like enzyme
VKILVAVYSPFAAWNIPVTHVERLRAEFPHHEFIHARTEDEVLPLIADAEAAFASELRAHHFAAAPRLRWVHSPAAGVGGMLLPAVVSSGIVISNSRAMSGDTIAEHVLALVLALYRKLPLAFRSQAERKWVQDEAMSGAPIRTIAGSRVVVIGLGGIGGATAKRFAALGASVTGIRRRLTHGAPHGVLHVLTADALPTVLPDADVVVIAAPQTAHTRTLIGAGELRLMKRDAILVNVSRGRLVDENALADALAAGLIGGAGLDVFEHEPLEPASPLWALPNVIITPHISGFRADHWDAAAAIFAENLRRLDAGAPLVNVVDKHAGY